MMRFLLATALGALLLAAPAAHAQVSSDRPGFGSSTSSVGQGIFQAELGVINAAFIDVGPFDFVSTSTPLFLRYGVTETIEVRGGTNLIDGLFGDGDSDVEAGFDVFTLGAKVEIPLQGISASIQPEITFNRDIDDAFLRVEANMGYPLGETLTASGFAVVATDFDFTSALLAGNLAAAFGPTLSGYAEAGVGLNESDNQLVIGAGLLALVAPNVQLDLSAQVPLDDTSIVGIFAFGVTYRTR